MLSETGNTLGTKKAKPEWPENKQKWPNSQLTWQHYVINPQPQPKTNLEALQMKTMSPQMKQTVQSAPADSQATSQEADKEMTNDASTVNASNTTMVQKLNSTNKKNANKTIFNYSR